MTTDRNTRLKMPTHIDAEGTVTWPQEVTCSPHRHFIIRTVGGQSFAVAGSCIHFPAEGFLSVNRADAIAVAMITPFGSLTLTEDDRHLTIASPAGGVEYMTANTPFSLRYRDWTIYALLDDHPVAALSASGMIVSNITSHDC